MIVCCEDVSRTLRENSLERKGQTFMTNVFLYLQLQTHLRLRANFTTAKEKNFFVLHGNIKQDTCLTINEMQTDAAQLMFNNLKYSIHGQLPGLRSHLSQVD